MRKKAVSLRLPISDVKCIKLLAGRLGVRESDIVRYALKAMLLKLSPLTDPQIKGSALVPLLLEGGADLVHSFDLDVQRLEKILNEGCTPNEMVSRDDLHLLAMTGGTAAVTIKHAAPAAPQGQPERRSSPARRYLYDKYLYRNGDGSGS